MFGRGLAGARRVGSSSAGAERAKPQIIAFGAQCRVIKDTIPSRCVVEEYTLFKAIASRRGANGEIRTRIEKDWSVQVPLRLRKWLEVG